MELRFYLVKQTDGYYVGFRNSTCGAESYPNGRLLLLEGIDQEEIILDFNKAFNFSCVDDDTIPCSMTPQENWFNFPINTGEKNYN
jgi:uncharacterized protein (DUF1684 family)